MIPVTSIANRVVPRSWPTAVAVFGGRSGWIDSTFPKILFGTDWPPRNNVGSPLYELERLIPLGERVQVGGNGATGVHSLFAILGQTRGSPCTYEVYQRRSCLPVFPFVNHVLHVGDGALRRRLPSSSSSSVPLTLSPRRMRVPRERDWLSFS